MVGELNFGLLDQNAPARAAGSFQQGQVNRLAMQQAEQDRAQNALAFQRQKQLIGDEQAVRQAYAQSGGDQNKLIESLKGAGQYQKAMELQGQIASQQAAQRKAQIEEGIKHVEVLRDFMGRVSDQQSLDATRQQIASIYGPEAAAKIPQAYDPAQFESIKKQALDAKAQLENHWKEADYQLNQRKQGFTESQGAQDLALRRQTLAQSAAQHAQTIGIEREKLAIKSATDPKLTEAQGKAVGFAARAAEAEKAISNLAKTGAEQPGKIKRIAESVPFIGSGLGTMANVTQSDSQQQVEQAQRNFINAVLRQESGATIADTEFDNARKQYFPQPGDSAAVKAQKANNRRTAIKALEVQAGPGVKMMQSSGSSGGWTVEEH